MEVQLRFILFFLFVSLATYGADAQTVGECDFENHSGRDGECWDTFDVLQEMGDVGDKLVHDVECREISDAIQSSGADLSPRQTMLNMAFTTYSNGYAAGASKPDDFVQVEMLTFCSENPGARLRDF